MFKTLKSYWWNDQPNFGDEIGHMILENLGYTVQWSTIEEADILTTGTILNIANGRNKEGCIVWGAGATDHDIQNTFDVRAVRGQITNDKLGTLVPTGDPALLAPLFWNQANKQYRLGVVRHYIDKRDYPMADIVIDAGQPVADVIRQITSCEFIISSSLHGFILATAYDIPAMRAPHPEVVTGDWKWADFLTSLDRPIKQIQQQLLDALK